MADHPLIGTTIGNYYVKREIASGGMAHILKGIHRITSHEVAIKVMKQEMVFKKKHLQEFEDEAKLIGRFKHPHIVKLWDYGFIPDPHKSRHRTPFMTMSLAEKGSLAGLTTGRVLPLAEVLQYAAPIAKALYHAHSKNIVHRDVKPQNVLADSENHLLVSDFGIAIISQSVQRTPHDVIGTFSFMSPEQFYGDETPATDQYALGIMVYLWLTGTYPFFVDHNDPEAWRTYSSLHNSSPVPPMHGVHPEISKVVTKALSKNPEDRFPTIVSFVNTLQEVYDWLGKEAEVKRQQIKNRYHEQIRQQQQTYIQELVVQQQSLQRALDLTVAAREEDISRMREEIERVDEERKRLIREKKQVQAELADSQGKSKKRISALEKREQELMQELAAARKEKAELEKMVKQKEEKEDKVASDWFDLFDKAIALPMPEEETEEVDEKVMVKKEEDKYHGTMSEKEHVDQLINQCKTLFGEERYVETLQLSERIILLDPKNKEGWFYKGISLCRFGKWEETLEPYTRVIKIDPIHVVAMRNKADSLNKLGRYTEALDMLEKALQINPNYAHAYYNKGVALANLGKYHESIEACDKAIKINPKDAKAYCSKGVALRRLGKNQEAIEAYDEAIKLNPKLADAYNNKGIVLRQLSKYQEAIEAYDQAIKLNPKDAKAYYNKGISLDELGKYQEAIEVFDKVIQINPKDSNAYCGKGVVLNELEKYQEAIEAYNQAIKLNPKDADTYYNKGYTREKLGKYEEALKAYDKALEINPKFKEAMSSKERVFKKLGREK